MADEGKIQYDISNNDFLIASKLQEKQVEAASRKKYSFKVESCNNNDLRICTNDVNSATIITSWYKSMTTRKTENHSQRHRFLKCCFILEGARKSVAFGEHFEVPITDKMMEIGYKLVACSDRGEKGYKQKTLIFISDFDNL